MPTIAITTMISTSVKARRVMGGPTRALRTMLLPEGCCQARPFPLGTAARTSRNPTPTVTDLAGRRSQTQLGLEFTDLMILKGDRRLEAGVHFVF